MAPYSSHLHSQKTRHDVQEQFKIPFFPFKNGNQTARERHQQQQNHQDFPLKCACIQPSLHRTHPFVEERHEAITFGFPCSHIFHYASISVDDSMNSNRVLLQPPWFPIICNSGHLRYPTKRAEGSFDVVCRYFWAEVSNKDVKVI